MGRFKPMESYQGSIFEIDEPVVRTRKNLVDAPKFLREGKIWISPEQAEYILENCFYEGQKPRSKTGTAHIDGLVGKMRRREKMTIITFGVVGSRVMLMDGYHRMGAVAKLGESREFVVHFQDCVDIVDFRLKYSAFDLREDVRLRSRGHALNETGFRETMGLSTAKVANSVLAAAELIAYGVNGRPGADAKIVAELYDLDAKQEQARKWRKEGAVWDKIVSWASGDLKTKMLLPPVTAVALVTLRHQKERAVLFWTSVAKNDGLRSGTPAHTLVKELMSEKTKLSRSATRFLLPARAWNAYFEKRSAGHFQLDVERFRIAGTDISHPLNGVVDDIKGGKFK